jgi:hypothetical protein
MRQLLVGRTATHVDQPFSQVAASTKVAHHSARLMRPWFSVMSSMMLRVMRTILQRESVEMAWSI